MPTYGHDPLMGFSPENGKQKITPLWVLSPEVENRLYLCLYSRKVYIVGIAKWAC